MSNLTIATYRLWKNAPTDPPDAVIQSAIDAVEEVVAERCGRAFTVASGSTTRLFAPMPGTTTLEIDDATAVTVVAENGSTIPAASYQLEPVNGMGHSGVAEPYSSIRLLGLRWTPDYLGEASVSVTGTFGWAALPQRYMEAVKIATADLLDAKDVRNGVVGFSDYAAMRVRDNGQVAALLARLTRTRSIGIA